MKKILIRLSLVFVSLVLPVIAFAEEVVAGGLDDAYKSIGAALGAGLAIGIAAAGGGMGQGKAVSAALEGIARNPGSSDKIFVPMIIGLALIESLVIYALLIAFMLVVKVPG
ncbi:MAG: F0F1 ATP synthase subunit C [Deltaproteobacteria bacterium]|nr:F0F1 ATP synthase subunit C [Deltaproteobacteria bacterium]